MGYALVFQKGNYLRWKNSATGDFWLLKELSEEELEAEKQKDAVGAAPLDAGEEDSEAEDDALNAFLGD